MQTKEVHMKRYFFCVCDTIKHSCHCPSQWLSKLIYRFVFPASESLTQHHHRRFTENCFFFSVSLYNVSCLSLILGLRKLIILCCCLSVNCSGSVLVTQLASCEHIIKWCVKSKSIKWNKKLMTNLYNLKSCSLSLHKYKKHRNM